MNISSLKSVPFCGTWEKAQEEQYNKLKEAGKIYDGDNQDFFSIRKKDGPFGIEFTEGGCKCLHGKTWNLVSFSKSLGVMNPKGTIIKNQDGSMKKVYYFDPRSPVVYKGTENRYRFEHIHGPNGPNPTKLEEKQILIYINEMPLLQ